MNEEIVKANVETALNADEFDVLDYIENQEVGTDEVTVYVNVKKAKELSKLLDERAVLLAERRAAQTRGHEEVLGLDEAFEDTEFDDEINALVDELEKTALIFELSTVAPALVRAIDKHYVATLDSNADEEAKTKHEENRIADILSRTIAGVRTGSGVRDLKPWDIERLKELEVKVYDEQFAKLASAMYTMVYTGTIFEEALTADFS